MRPERLSTTAGPGRRTRIVGRCGATQARNGRRKEAERVLMTKDKGLFDTIRKREPNFDRIHAALREFAAGKLVT